VVILATVATIIASQALITGVFSLSSQAVALGLFPKIKIIHTSHETQGQIYIPFVNVALAIGCIALVLAFRASGGLAAAYGIAVTGTMLITTVIFYLIIRHLWKWSLWIITPTIIVLLGIDMAFFAGTMLKFWQGGFVPIIIGIVLFIIMATWDWGRDQSRAAHLALPGISVGQFVEYQTERQKNLLHRSVVVMSSRPIITQEDRIPAALDSFMSKWGISIPKHLIFLNVCFLNTPINKSERYVIHNLQTNPEIGTITSVQAFYGYTETPDIRELLIELKEQRKIRIPSDPKKWLVLVGVDRFITKPKNILHRIGIALVNLVLRHAKPVTSYYGLDHDNKVDVEIINI
jgi:KUP system potassium uptake protein